MNGYGAGIRQHDTHRSISPDRASQRNPRTGALGLDAIIVPGTRPAAYLDHAVTLARAAKCSLVILCSHYLHGHEVKEYLDARSFSEAIVIRPSARIFAPAIQLPWIARHQGPPAS